MSAVSGKSSETPAPPWIWMAASITFWAMLGATTLICEISLIAPLAPTVSIIHAALSVSSRACSIAMRAFATRRALPPSCARGLPKATRLSARAHRSSSARSAAPITRMQWWMRPGPRRPCAISKPRPMPAITFSFGTRTLSNVISPWPKGSS